MFTVKRFEYKIGDFIEVYVRDIPAAVSEIVKNKGTLEHKVLLVLNSMAEKFTMHRTYRINFDSSIISYKKINKKSIKVLKTLYVG